MNQVYSLTRTIYYIIVGETICKFSRILFSRECSGLIFLGHVGITLGAAAAAAGMVQRRGEKVSWWAALSKYADLRLLVIGSMLPDIIDKPVGHVFFRKTFENGRIFSHTLLFLIVIAAIGFWIYKKRHSNWIIVLAFGTLVHLICDAMWKTPETLFWPLLGWAFPKLDLEAWAHGLWHAICTEPTLYIPEIFGLIVVLWLAIAVFRRKQVGNLIKRGRIS
jgi:inner membrane protein